MRREPHPFSGVIYEDVGGGVVRVEDRENGKSGLFKWDGAWIEGDLTHADPHLLSYIGGPDLPPGRDIPWIVLPPVEDESTAKPSSGGEGAAQTPRIIGKYVPDPGKQTDQGMRSGGYRSLEFFLDNERRPDLLPDVYRLSSPMPGGPKKIQTDRFYKKEYHDLEVEKLWKKTWQMACREDDIPEVGDYYVYKIADLSYLVVRTGENEFKAHVNACLHRGRLLREAGGKKATDFRCPYHGWSWKLDGSIKEITTEWDFPGVREDVCKLPAAKVGTWGGFIFINPDPNATQTLEEFMGPVMLEHYRKVKLQNRYKQAHVVKVLRCNWKIAMEAFLEGYHVIATHPQVLMTGGDVTECRYDVFGNWSRAGHVGTGQASPLRGILPSAEQELEIYRQRADGYREYLRSILGDEVEQYSDAELNDSSFNNLFPNFQPWGGWGRIVYRFRPNGDNPDECIMDAMLLAPWPEGKPKPPPHPTRHLGPDDPWVNAPELGSLAKIFDQDCGNMPQVHLGLKTKTPDYVWYSAYQESIIRNFHRNYERALGLSDAGGASS